MKKICLWIPVLALLLGGLVCAGGKGKVAVAVEGKTAAAEVSGVAARSPHFLIFERSDGTLLEVVDNPLAGSQRGAGHSIVVFLAEKGVTFIVAGRFGEKMIRAMEERGIQYLECHGSADSALHKALGTGESPSRGKGEE